MHEHKDYDCRGPGWPNYFTPHLNSKSRSWRPRCVWSPAGSCQEGFESQLGTNDLHVQEEQNRNCTRTRAIGDVCPMGVQEEPSKNCYLWALMGYHQQLLFPLPPHLFARRRLSRVVFHYPGLPVSLLQLCYHQHLGDWRLRNE